jgi:hypothetical protein
MKPTIYLETSIISYLTARPSRDLIVAANQEMTSEWWNNHRDRFALYVSQLVIEEAKAGDEHAAQKRLTLLDSIPLLAPSEEGLALAQRLLDAGFLPDKAARDAAHIAIATIHGMDYLLTWNCRHIANATIRNDIVRVCHANGYESPVICTPQELLEG